ncbi:epoxide hydrolase family protein [Sphingomonas qomolangmaensis]|uniref:Epoxide hydrolase n=1 Tax=Sphingomonas qomolangmaensis TaxID=2918765 RepID=A0ABY5LA04_9SPHN|nr:epoxide hydrolase family protein [Sphingomonas qomolangmaensis]UUL83795.1 epoxide hydrolase [Sphingomonas qomolangmaensis]
MNRSNPTGRDTVTAFPIRVPDADLTYLGDRLRGTRWPDAGTATDRRQGPDLPTIQRLVDRWRDGYDWRATEALLNGWGSSRTVIDGLGIHFLHVRSPQADATPLLLTHGWPGSILEFRDVIGPLSDPVSHGGSASDAFHVVIPSLPGFGFSDKPSEPGWGVGRTATAWIELMHRLGYRDRWFAQGGDWGAAVTSALAHMRAPGLSGIHLNMVMFQPTLEEVENATPDERRMLADAQRYDREYSAYMKLQCTRPQSAAFALADSPIGLAAWIYALFQDVSDSGGRPERVIALDHLIDDVMLYWLPNAGPSSARFYWEAAQEMAQGIVHDPMPLPAGVSMFPGEQVRLSKRWAERRFADLRFFAEADRGGHFAAMENPPIFVEHVRATFRTMP